MSNWERHRNKRRDEDRAIYELHGWICQTCREDCRRHHRPQLAHKIAQSLMNYSRFGAEIIDHPMNRVPTCSLACNDAQNIGFNPGKCRALLEDIRRASPELSDHIDDVIRIQRLPPLPGGAA